MKGVVNSFFSWFFKKRLTQIQSFIQYPGESQNQILRYLLERGERTRFGNEFNFREIRDYESFRKKIPVWKYESFKPYIDRILRGEQNITWPTKIKWFAKSSGTTSDRSKYIPVSKEALEDCHYKAGKDMMGLYYQMEPEASIFTGKSLVMGGSHQINKLNEQSSFGDLSAVLVQNLPLWAQLWRSPDLKVALMKDWEKKIDRIARETLDENITSIFGVPTWTVVLLNKILELSGRDNITETWPNLELFVHGGVSFIPYRDLFRSLISKEINYMETYNASEGFFGIQDLPRSDEMLLMLDYGIFYEFYPLEENGEITRENLIPLWEVEKGKNYAMVITTNSGLWRYDLGDTVRFTSLEPYRVKITGRTKYFINAFGEEVIEENAEKALAVACEKTGSMICDYTAAPVYFDYDKKGGHEWLIEFEKEPEDLRIFSNILDETLQKENSDYEAKRYKGMALNPPVVRKMQPGTFYEWMKKCGKLGGQHKVPRLSNHRKYLDDILEFARVKLNR